MAFGSGARYGPRVHATTVADLEWLPSTEFDLLPLLKHLDPFNDDARVDPALSLIGWERRERQRSVMFNSGI
jgi:hypothetical protein